MKEYNVLNPLKKFLATRPSDKLLVPFTIYCMIMEVLTSTIHSKMKVIPYCLKLSD